ncbi:hypothetical protein [Rhodovulum steppense]|uniref:Uncharacterized protein n=1 Tax=Rhodovulum steppense TaxID=540251 RepID=A0A4R1YGY5_9RHOB|nr:hypothetical protein [Rhodovulum steppense]TCM75425.1 hypothetical protein EV216_13913 [Rhodovulum steppense]
MAILDDLADTLAREALELAEQLDDERLIDEMAKAIGESSPTSQEAFMTAVRIRRALGRGRAVMERKRGTRALPPPEQGDPA